MILAAGLGSRFGGRKQLVEVDSDGAAIMDILLRRAAAAGFSYAVVVVAPAMEGAVRAHLELMRGAPGSHALSTELAVQRLPAGRSRPLGTADAVLAAREKVHGPFVVVNADDLYPADAFVLAADHLRTAAVDEHAMVGFRVARTLTGNRPVSRALVHVDNARLVTAREGTVVKDVDGLWFETDASVLPLRGDECVSMNMWVFRDSVFAALAGGVAAFVAGGCVGEVFLPDVVASIVQSGEVVRVVISESTCIGVTHDEDIVAVRAALG